MLESTGAKVYFVHYTPEIEEARSRGELRVNSFVQMRNISASRTLLDVQDFGNAEALLTNPQYFRNAAKSLLNHGRTPTEDGWGGWLGRYHAKLAEAARHIAEIEHQAQSAKGRKRDRPFGR